MAVLFLLAGAEDNVLLAWASVRKCLDALNEDDRNGDIYTSFERVLVSEFPKFGI